MGEHLERGCLCIPDAPPHPIGSQGCLYSKPPTVTPDPSDPGWFDPGIHDTRTLDCRSDDHGNCFLPTHCQCPCHRHSDEEAAP